MNTQAKCLNPEHHRAECECGVGIRRETAVGAICDAHGVPESSAARPAVAAFVAAALAEFAASEVRRERERIAALADEVGATYTTAEPNPDGPGEVVSYHDFAERIREGRS